MNINFMVIVREICRQLLTTDRSINEIARTLLTTARRVALIKTRLSEIKLSLSEIDNIGDKKLRKLIYPKQRNRYVRRYPNWVEIHELMRQKHQTLIQIW